MDFLKSSEINFTRLMNDVASEGKSLFLVVSSGKKVLNFHPVQTRNAEKYLT
jgi:hypothetical protein